MDARKVVVIDNGGGTIKVGLANEPAPRCILPNCVARPRSDKKNYYGDQIGGIKDISSINLRRPIEKGYVTNWELQKDIWAHVFKSVLKVDPSKCWLLVTEPPFNLPALQGALDEVAFAEFKFLGVCVLSAAAASMHHVLRTMPDLPAAAKDTQCGLVLDVGFSFTHAIPVFDGKVLEEGIIRINLGGKALTNYLKELVSFRAWNMMDEYLIIEDVKEKLAFVSQDLRSDLAMAKKPVHTNQLRREYVLPDGVKNVRGYVKEFDLAALQTAAARRRGPGQGGAEGDEEQVLPLANERFMVPEALFNPSDLGVNQAGLAESLVLAVQRTHPDLHPLLFQNVVCTGGCSTIPGFVERLYTDMRPLMPDDMELGIRLPENPITAAWQGARDWARTPACAAAVVAREAWQKRGNRAAQQGHRVAWTRDGKK